MNTAIDNYRKKSIPICVLVLVITNVVVFFMCQGYEDYFYAGALNYNYISINKEYGRLISHMFIHANGEHLLGNMFALYVFGEDIEKRIGSLKFSLIYIISGFGSGILSLWFNHVTRPDYNVFCAGASGAVYGIMAASMFLQNRNNELSKEDAKKNMAKSILFVVVLALLSYKKNVGLSAHIFGAIIGGIVAYIFIVTKLCDIKEKSFSKGLGIIVMIAFCIMGFGESNVSKGMNALADPRVDIVKNMAIEGVDYILRNSDKKDRTEEINKLTYGGVLDNYCMNGKWSAFESTNKKDVVELNADVLYKGEIKKLKMQFVCENNKYDIGYFEIDNVPKSGEDYVAFLKKACESYLK